MEKPPKWGAFLVDCGFVAGAVQVGLILLERPGSITGAGSVVLFWTMTRTLNWSSGRLWLPSAIDAREMKLVIDSLQT